MKRSAPSFLDKLPWIITGLCLVWMLTQIRYPAEKTWNTRQFGELPLLANGRVQPMDSLARNSLLQIRDKQVVRNKVPGEGGKLESRKMDAIEWLMEVMMNPDEANTRPIFRIDHPELVSLLNLPGKDRKLGLDGKHFSWNQIEPKLSSLQEQGRRIAEIESAHRTPFEKAVAALQNRLFLYMRLKNTIHPQDTQDFQAELKEYESVMGPGLAAFRAQQSGQEFDQQAVDNFTRLVNRYDVMVRMDTPLLVPPQAGSHLNEDWKPIGEALIEFIHGQPIPDAVESYAALSTAYRTGQVEEFNRLVGEFQSRLAGPFAPEVKKVRSEHFFNHLDTFYKSSVLYVLAFILACGSWVRMSDWMRRTAVYLIVLGFVIHTSGLLFRMFLEGRPPVTNLYSSAIFIGWGSVVLGLVLERFYKDGIGAVVASSIGFITLIIAHHLSIGGDTMEMMRAVLDTNFWLATHVVVVTLGYAATFVAGFLAIIYLIRGFFTRSLSAGTEKSLSRMVYGIICFATLFSFVGTVLGGIWADQSWGRFWGWDPKENGALIIVLWNALILHARWGGLVRERGLMNMAIVGNIVTAWSWFGVNMLGIGLHSYGFMDAAFWWLMLFVGSQLLLIAIGLVPKERWLSFRTAASRQAGPSGIPAPRT